MEITTQNTAELTTQTAATKTLSTYERVYGILNLSDTVQEDVIRIILSKNQVDPNGLRSRLNRATQLMLAWVGDTLVGVVALKRPYKSYTHKISMKTGIDIYDFPEVGYLAVLPEYDPHTVGRVLLSKLLENIAGNVFFTSRVGDTVTSSILLQANFSPYGTTYSGIAGDDIRLWTRHLVSVRQPLCVPVTPIAALATPENEVSSLTD